MTESWLIRIIAGVNGAGKSSIGDVLRRRGGDYWNPDRATERLREANPELSLREANIAAWEAGRDRLRAAIRERHHFVFETTLGGRTITGILQEGIGSGALIHMIYIGLEGVDLHIHRVRLRVEKGGHDIPESRIRERYRHSRENLIRLLPGLARLDLYDNSTEARPGQRVTPVRVLTLIHGKIEYCVDPEDVPAWARSIVMRAMKLDRKLDR